MFKLLKNQRGQIMILFVLLLPIIIGSVGLAVDVSHIIYQKNKMQDALDLSIITGALELPESFSSAVQVTKNYWEMNGFNKENITVTTPYNSNPNKIHAQSSTNLPLIFMPILKINTKNITVSAAAEVILTGSSHPVFDYVLFSASTTQKLQSSFDSVIFDGKVHCNQDMVVSGGNNIFNDDLEIVGNKELKVSNVYNGNVINPASVIPIPVYDINELRNKATTIYNGDYSASGFLELNGILFVDGDVSVSGGNCVIRGKGSIVATGKISISASNFSYESGNDLIALYSLTDISLSGGNKTIQGIIYAPNGEITITGGNDTYYGAIIGNTIRISNGGYRFIYDPRAKNAIYGESSKSVRLIE